MNRKKVFLMGLAILVGVLLIGSVGCGPSATESQMAYQIDQMAKQMNQIVPKVEQLWQERQEQEAEKQRVTEEKTEKEKIAQIVQEQMAGFEQRVEHGLSELKSKIDTLLEEPEVAPTWPDWRYYRPSPPTPTYPSYRPPEYPTGKFKSWVCRGTNLDSAQYVGSLPEISTINYDWGYYGGPLGLTGDFSVRWEGFFWFEEGNYRFTVVSSDGVMLWIDGTHLMGQWTPQEPRTYWRETFLRGYHWITLDYFQQTGRAIISLSWTRIN